jgi:hypothetical protein
MKAKIRSKTLREKTFKKNERIGAFWSEFFDFISLPYLFIKTCLFFALVILEFSKV